MLKNMIAFSEEKELSRNWLQIRWFELLQVFAFALRMTFKCLGTTGNPIRNSMSSWTRLSFRMERTRSARVPSTLDQPQLIRTPRMPNGYSASSGRCVVSTSTLIPTSANGCRLWEIHWRCSLVISSTGKLSFSQNYPQCPAKRTPRRNNSSPLLPYYVCWYGHWCLN